MSVKEKIAFIQKNFRLINKQELLVPVKLYPVQRHYIENRKNRNVCLKGRQMGFSTGVEMDNSEDLFNLPYQRQAIITHDSETSEFLFQNVQRFYRNLPWNKGKPEDKMTPIHDWKSGTRMRFPVIDSYIYIDSAKSDSIGIGHTMSRCHLSELSRWPDRKARQLWSDITQTVPLNGIITAESTPRGKTGLFYEIYRDAKKGTNNFQAMFYPWWWDPGYLASVEDYMTDEKAEQVSEIMGQSLENFLKDEKNFAEHFELSQEQLAFRRMKIGEIKLLFFQEYPENDEDCWLSSEMSVIDGGTLRPYYAEVREGKIEGNTTIWKDVIGGRDYVIGVDVASGQARDFSVASVIEVKSLQYVARLRGKIRTDLFSEQLITLGRRYNDAMLAVERANHGHSVLMTLLQREYPNIYYHTDYDDAKAANITDAGWKTSPKTKPLMVNKMITAFGSHDLISWSENLLTEASGLTWEGGIDSRVRTISGDNDDEWDAVSIALMVRDSVPVLESGQSSGMISSYAEAF